MKQEDYDLLVSVLIEAENRWRLEASLMKKDRPTFAAEILAKADRLREIRDMAERAWMRAQRSIELAESEDERIRKEIIHYLFYIAGGLSTEEQNRWIAYLEKQKEQTEDLYEGLVNTFNIDESSVAHENDFVSKSAEWSEEDKKALDICCFIIGSIDTYHDPILRQKCLDFLYYLPKRFALPPKVEWSEEDETIIDCAVEVVEKAGLPSLAASLKSLRPQPKDKIYKGTDETYKLGKHHLADIEMERDSFNKHVTEYGDEVVWLNWLSFVDIANYFYELGKKDMKEQMLKDAVEGYVNYYEDSGGILMAEAQVGSPYHNGDKVRIIIVKEENK